MSFRFICPNCGESFICEDDWEGTSCSCPGCNDNIVLVPRRFDADLMRDQYRRREAPAQSRGIFALVVKLVFILGLIAGGVFLYVKITTPTPKSLSGNQLYVMTGKRVNRGGAMGMADIVKHDFFPIASSKAAQGVL